MSPIIRKIKLQVMNWHLTPIRVAFITKMAKTVNENVGLEREREKPPYNVREGGN